MGVRDLLAAKLEEHADTIVRSLLSACESGDWRAAEAWLTRVYGKPQESVEISTADGLDLTQLSSEELEQLRLQLLREQGADVLPLYPARTQAVQ